MDLLQQELNNNGNKKENKSKKKVLSLLIFCIILLVLALIGRTVIKTKPEPKELTIAINGEFLKIDSTTLINSNEKTYISIEGICKQLGYEYTRGRIFGVYRR